jgi:hypothetical protein
LVRAISVIRLFAHLLILPVFRSFSIMLLTITKLCEKFAEFVKFVSSLFGKDSVATTRKV